MKKLSLFITAGLILFLASCQPPASSPSNPADPESGLNNAKLQEKKNVYKILIDTEWELDPEIKNKTGLLKSINFKNDSITIDGTQYSLNQNTDFYFQEELPSTCPYKTGGYNCPLYIFINNNWYGLEQYKLPKSTNNSYLGIWNKSNAYSDMILKSGGGQSGGEPSAFKGTYSFSAASGTETNGSISLNEGNWTYSGSKTNVAAKSGTYSVNGSKITLSWTAGGSPVTEEFTVTVNGSSATWQSSNAVSSTLFSMLFGVAGKTSLTLNYSE